MPADFGARVREAAADIAAAVGAPTFCFHVADDDDFEYLFFRDGRLADQYRAKPNAYDPLPRAERPAWRGKPETFADLLGSATKVEECQRVLRFKREVFESDRLEKFARLFGLPHALHAYTDFDTEADTIPGARHFIHVPDDSAEKSQARRESARIRAESRAKQKSGVLLAAPRPPRFATKWEKDHVWMDWVVEPGNSVLVHWSHHTAPGAPLRRERWSFPWATPVPVSDEPFPAGSMPRAFSADGQQAAVITATHNAPAELWDWPPTHRRFELPRAGGWMGFSPDGRWVYLIEEASLIAISTADGTEQARRRWDRAPKGAAVHPNGQHLVLNHEDGMIEILDVGSLATLRVDAPFYRPSFSLGSQQFFAWMAEQQSQVTIENFGTAALLQRCNPERVRSIRLSGDGRWLAAAADHGLKVFAWDDLSSEGETAPRFSCAARPRQDAMSQWTGCNTAAFDDRRALVLFAGLEGVVEYLDLGSGRSGELLRPPELQSISRLELLPDGSAFVIWAHKYIPRTRQRPPEVGIWNYPALLEAAGLTA